MSQTDSQLEGCAVGVASAAPFSLRKSAPRPLRFAHIWTTQLSQPILVWPESYTNGRE